ncbi:ATP-binding protein [Deinococcus sp. RIT780]|uniref:ATP-binding protein n=1 Tax=Deinococcus sp. RIT780 TaxID=2870472 RepID=UPI001C8A2F6E|nr:ATP-binding protein [Deinococcus sp. RIT780]MBX8463595.1 GAF domain-containing protein [Deinococcus sp. RIT780]
MTAPTSSLLRRWQEVISALSTAVTLSQVRDALRGLGAAVDLAHPDDPPEPFPDSLPGTVTVELPVSGATGPLTARLHFASDTPLGDVDHALLAALPPLIGAALTRTALPDGGRTRDREAALRAFMLLTEELGDASDPDALIRSADRGVRQLLPGVSLAYMDRVGSGWCVRFMSGNIELDLTGAAPGGFLTGISALDSAVRSGQPTFIDHWDAGAQGLPQTARYRAAALQAFYRDGQVSGLLAVGTTDHDTWTDLERGVFSAACRSLNLALSRAWHVQQLAEERAALAAFVSFEEQVLHTTDLLDLSTRAADVLRATLGDVDVAYLEAHHGQWTPVTPAADLPPDLTDLLGGPLAPDTHTALTAQQAGQTLFLPFPDAPAGPHVPRAFAVHVTLRDGHPAGMLVMLNRAGRDWTERERSVFRSVGRSLGMALDRAAKDDLLRNQNASLQAQTRSLEAFAQLSADLGAQEDRYALIRRAQEVALSLLPTGFAVYYEPDTAPGGPRLWRLKSQVGDMGNPELQRTVDAGLDFERTLNLITPWRTREPLYQDAYALDTDGLTHTDGVGATACLPLLENGTPVGVFCIAQDHARPWTPADRSLLSSVTRSLALALDRARSVTELRRYSAELERSNAAMHAANEELEAFAYSVSHDLRAPVRHIAGFADLLRKALGNELDANPKAARALNIITESTAHMNELIDAMLNLSRTARQELRVGPVDLNDLVRGVQTDLKPDLKGRSVQWRVSELPAVQGDAALLRQVLSNLMGNAVKYTTRRPEALIEIWAEAHPERWTVHVRDNGVGFDSRYAHKLFGVFQRLHRPEEFGGTGVGLANVRRILSRHGGSWAAQGAPDQGATFSFSLPRTD